MISPITSTLPTCLIYLVFRYLPHEELAPLVRSNRSLYQICNPLLYREIHLHRPVQLAKLSRGPRMTQLLKHTKSMLIDHCVLSPAAWDIGLLGSAHPAEFLVNVWRATTSLRRLQICPSDLPPLSVGPIDRLKNTSHGDDDLAPYRTLLHYAATDPTFLPQLTSGITIEPKHYQGELGPNWWWCVDYFEDLFKHRPVKFHAHLSAATMTLKLGWHGSSRDCSFRAPPYNSHWLDLASDVRDVFEALESSPWFLVLDVSLGTHIYLSNLEVFSYWLFVLVAISTTATPNLKILSIRLSGTVTATQLFTVTKRPNFFGPFNKIAPLLETITFLLPNQQVVQWWKVLDLYRTPMHKDINWVPVISHPHLRQEVLAWWIDKLFSPGAGIVGVPGLEEIKRLAVSLYGSTRFGRDSRELTQGMIINELLVYYGNVST